MKHLGTNNFFGEAHEFCRKRACLTNLNEFFYDKMSEYSCIHVVGIIKVVDIKKPLIKCPIVGLWQKSSLGVLGIRELL